MNEGSTIDHVQKRFSGEQQGIDIIAPLMKPGTEERDHRALVLEKRDESLRVVGYRDLD